LAVDAGHTADTDFFLFKIHCFIHTKAIISVNYEEIVKGF
jgi:hypothetical protein